MTAPLRSGDPITVNVALGARAYDIVIGRGLLATLGERIDDAPAGLQGRDRHRRDRGAPSSRGGRSSACRAPASSASPIVVPAGEGIKSFAHASRRSATGCSPPDRARRSRGRARRRRGRRSRRVCRRRSCAAASTTCRCRRPCWRRSTLRRRQDRRSTRRHGKNLVGAFHQPILVIADTALLDTLPEREFRAGYAEVVKYGLLGDAGFFAWLEANWQRRVRRRRLRNAREHAIAVSCRAKAAIVARDERETGDRALLNLGHTFGHALRGGGRLLRQAAARRGGRARHGAGVRVLGPARADCRRRRRRASSRILRRSVCPPMSKPCPAAMADVDAMMDLISQDKKVQARPAHLHPGARHRRRPSSPGDVDARRGSRVPRRKACPATR